MMYPVIKTNYTLPPICTSEILRYSGCKEPSVEVSELLQSCMEECEGIFKGNVCYTELSFKIEGSIIDFGFFKVDSSDLKKNLSGCESVVVFGATVGMELDRLLRKYSAISPARAVILQAVGAERIEALCNAFCQDLMFEKAKIGYEIRPRFSAGYGDLSLNAQKDIFKLLDCSRKIGLTLNESLLMTPTKSVTAFVGIGRK